MNNVNEVDTISQKPDSNIIETHIKNVENLKISETKSEIDGEQEEMQRAIVNINRKTRPLIKHVSVVKNDILHIDVEKKTVCKLNIHLNEVSNWEDLFNEDDDINGDYVNKVIWSILKKKKIDYLQENKTHLTHIFFLFVFFFCCCSAIN